MISKNITVINKLGIHARSASKLAALCAQFESTISLQNTQNSASANGKSIMDLLLLEAVVGTELKVECEGSDAEATMVAISQLFATCFGEDH